MANSKISALTAAVAAAAANEFAINEAGVSKKLSASQLSVFFNANISLGASLDVNSQEITSASGTDIVLHSDNDTNIILGDAAGVDDFNIKDSGDVTVASINSDGALTAVSYGGILESNLLDKSATETIIGSWTFPSLTLTGAITGATIDADLNTVTNIEDADIKAAAGIQESKLAIDFIAGATYTTTADLHKVSDSNGVITGGQITDGGSGTVDIAAGSCLIRSTNSALGELKSTDFSAVTGQALTDLTLNFIYVDYNAGSPVVAVQTTPLADPHTKVVLGSAYRNGTDVHISNISVPTAQSTQLASLRLGAVDGLTRQSGAIISETGTRNLAATAGTWWTGLIQTTTASFDSSGIDTFKYYYQDGLGGFTTVSSQTQIDNTQYDDGSGTLATLGPAKYGVHWVYAEVDGEWAVVYGRGSYTLAAATAATPPANIPGQLFPLHAALAGKIIIQVNDTTFTSIQTAFETSFGLGVAQDHGDLAGLADDDHTQYFNQARMDDGTLTSLTTSGNAVIEGGTLNVGDATQDGKIILEGTSTNNLEVYASSSEYGAIDSQVDIHLNVDTNANQTGQFFQIGQNATGSSGVPIARFTEGTTTGSDSITRIYGNLDVDNGADVTGNITVTGTVDGRDVATDGTTLDTHVALANEHIDWTSTSSNFSTTGTISLGSVIGDRINIFSTSYKIGIAAGTLFYDVASTAHHEWRVNGVEIARADVTAFDVTGNITVSGTVDGRDVATDGTKLDGIEALADVTDETNVTDALDGATLTAATVAGTDKVFIQDTDDLDILKTATAQSIADLAVAGTPTDITVANEATDTTCFPSFFTAATGDLGPKTNANLIYNSSTSALGLTGELDVDNLNLNGNSLTSTNLNGDINVHPNTAGTLNLHDGAALLESDGLFGSTTLYLQTRFGTATVPAIAPSTNSDTGMYFPNSATEIGFSIDAVEKINLSATAMSITEPVTITDTTDATSASTGALILDGGLGLDKTIYSGDTTDTTSALSGSIITPGGIYAAKNIRSDGLISNNPWEYVGFSSGTLGSTDATVSVAVSGYKTYKVYVRCEGQNDDATTNYIRCILNGVLTSSTYVQYYTTATTTTNLATDTTTQGVNIGGITDSDEAATYHEFIVSAPTGAGAASNRNFGIRVCDSGLYFRHPSEQPAQLKGGSWQPTATNDVTNIGIKAFTTINGDTAISTDNLDVFVWVYGCNLQTTPPWT